MISRVSATEAWACAVSILSQLPAGPSPRGMLTKEVIGAQICVADPCYRIVDYRGRNLNYRFMLAEFCWMALGMDELYPLTKYNSKMAQFSDDGITLAGAYGPAWDKQAFVAYRKILQDPDTRQAVISIWKPNPQPSKDIPCTTTMQFLLRDMKLYMIVTMRSQDAWLGLPYDLFNFMSLQALMAGRLGVMPGRFTLHVGSLHLYEQHFDEAKFVNPIFAYQGIRCPPMLPCRSVSISPPEEVYLELIGGNQAQLGTINVGYDWNTILQGLRAPSSIEAYKVLVERWG